jgi:uncharacterized FlaG/YvyC family protein
VEDFGASAQRYPAPPPATRPTPAAVSAVANPPARPSAQTVQSALQQINAHLAGVDRKLSLTVDPLSGHTVAEISNAQTGEVLQQMPTKDELQLELMLARWSQGGNVLMDVEA